MKYEYYFTAQSDEKFQTFNADGLMAAAIYAINQTGDFSSVKYIVGGLNHGLYRSSIGTEVIIKELNQ